MKRMRGIVMLNYLEQTMKNPLLTVLLITIMFDIATGVLKAFVNNNLNSTINKNGLSKHTGVMLLVILVIIIFKPLEMESLINTILSFYIFSYMLSIIENLILIGVPVPEWLKDKFMFLRSENDEIKGIKK